MPRRRRSGIHFSQLLGLVAGIVFLISVAIVVLFLFLANPTGGSDEGAGRRTRVSAAHELNVSEYLDNANALRGNSYRVSGRVEDRLHWSRDHGRFISVLVSAAGESSPIPILVPPEFTHLNLEKGAQLTFVVEVRNDGVLVAKSAKPG